MQRRLVVAAGIGSFTYRPPEFAGLPRSLASHTSKILNSKVCWKNKSSLSEAVRVHWNRPHYCTKAAPKSEIVARARQIRWLGGLVSKTIHYSLGPKISKILYAPTDVGPAGISQVVARPDLVKRLPRSVQDWLRKRSIRPAGARWLVARNPERSNDPRTFYCFRCSGWGTGKSPTGRRKRENHRPCPSGNRISSRRFQVRFPCSGTRAVHKSFPRISSAQGRV